MTNDRIRLISLAQRRLSGDELEDMYDFIATLGDESVETYLDALMRGAVGFTEEDQKRHC